MEKKKKIYYPITSNPRGLCIIINNQIFNDAERFKTRRGSDVDERNLHWIFKNLGFNVQTLRNLKSDDIIECAITHAYKTDHSNYDCFVFCIMSHGGKGTIYGTDGEPIRIDIITDHFKGINCKSLRKKPKIFFIQACQGRTLETGFEADAEKDLSIASASDFLIGYATVPGNVSWPDPETGSWYISTLVRKLEKHCCNSLDLEDILTRVTRKIAENEKSSADDAPCKQCPLKHSTLRMKVVLKEMAECQQLEVPESSAVAVVEAMKSLNRQLGTDLMKNYMKEVGEYLYVANNATAKDADLQIKVKRFLCDPVKLCDAWNVMLTSFNVGASDILEKLHVAFLKLLGGFPDLALADVQSVTKHVSSMKAAGEKARGSFTECRQELNEVIAFLGKEKRKLEGKCHEFSTDYSKEIERLELVCSDKAFEIEDTSIRLAYLDREDLRDKYQAVKKMIPNWALGEKELGMALPKLDEAVDLLKKAERLVDCWCNECKEVVQKNRMLNVNPADKTSEAEQKEFWKTLPFVQTANQFLCRWKALQQICLSTSSHMHRVKGDTDWYYSENLDPSEAVQKAWKMLENQKDLPETLRPYPDMVVPEASRNKALCSLAELMVLSSAPKDIFKLKKHGKNIENIGMYLGIIECTGVLPAGADSPVQKMKQDLGTLLSLLHSAAVQLNAASFDVILKMHLTSLCILDGMSVAAGRELNTICDDGEYFGQVIDQITTYRAEINTSGSLVALQKKLDDHVSKLETRLKKEVSEEVRVANPGNIESYISRGYNLVNMVKYFVAGSSKSLSSDNTAEQIKLSIFSKEMLQLISEEFPILDIEGVYKEIWDNLNDQVVSGREELRVVVEALQGETLGHEIRGPEWQEGIVKLMMQLNDLHIASRAQASSLKALSDRFQRKGTRHNWLACMEMVSKVDSAADSYARKINREVDGNVQHIRAVLAQVEEMRKRQKEEMIRWSEAIEKRLLEEEEKKRKREKDEESKRREQERLKEEQRKLSLTQKKVGSATTMPAGCGVGNEIPEISSRKPQPYFMSRTEMSQLNVKETVAGNERHGGSQRGGHLPDQGATIDAQIKHTSSEIYLGRPPQQ